MNNCQEQIKQSYETLNMSLEEIAEDQEMPLSSIKAALMNCSSKYRKACGLVDEDNNGLNFTDDELRTVNKVIMELAIGATTPDGQPDNRLRGEMCKYVRDDKKGRKEPVRQIAGMGNNFNILMFNERMVEARKKVEELKEARCLTLSGPR